ncbi:MULTISPECIES: SAM-dependent chlorinase/fluorinase [unclassified Moorena]|uniref:SAM hydrolase/SAM-dependent halogenase family protein n=1 Tax=unclassified Moorena TaxID=2683338 RepID=UPI0013B610E4|nr:MULTISPECIES: SAM-dependent chlorinase/fluorinase [unclassified Moorena]NEP32138.1 SAM-dependent chlorinase/fluorinase [Moorena sp. SIO3B2]NEQ06206.1 SAM-dependent chlorinase/fluorinase [Moorena sp. SIO4E2]
MPQNRIITLLSDFGLQDVYVGVMKGVIAQVNPTLTIVDLTHQIPPQNLAAARFNLLNAYPYFPAGTVHVAVVDPGVGSHRRAIAIQLSQGFLVGPDNGLFSGVLEQYPLMAAVELSNSDYWRTRNPSTTFHGRDIFASVGAHLASGLPIERLGEVIEPNTLVTLDMPIKRLTDDGIIGSIQYVDHFGNLITNIPGAEVDGKIWSVKISDRIIPHTQTYSNCPLGEYVALIGSHGWVEIAVNGGSAKSQLQLDWGDTVELSIKN